MGMQNISFEEFTTLLTRVNVVLNSRSLCAVSSNPNNLEVLTPGHTLTRRPLNAPSTPDITDIPTSRLFKWPLIMKIHQSLWKRWNVEYLHNPQQRSRWMDYTRTGDLA